MPTNEKYIQRRNGKYRVILPRAIADAVSGGKRALATCDTLKQAIFVRDQALSVAEGPAGPVIEGLTTDEQIDIAQVWNRVFEAQAATVERERVRATQSIAMPSGPFGIVYWSDWHVGDPYCDYRQLKTDAETIRDTPGMYAIHVGDGWNNWIVGKLQQLQRGEPIPFDAEVALFCDVVNMVAGKWLVAIPGNHANWTRLLAGIDQVRQAFSSARVLYDPYEVVFTLKYGSDSLVFKARHQWRWSSVFNSTHGIEASWQRGDTDFDIGIGGHTHIGTYCRPFARHGRKRWAVLVGTYKVGGDFGRELGLPRPVGRGAGAHIFREGYPPLFIEDVQTAAEILTYLRGKAGQ